MTPPMSVETLRKLISCDYETGNLTYLYRPRGLFKKNKDYLRWNSMFAGKPALSSINPKGYRCGSIWGREYKAHRVVWALFSGEWPSEEVDHINGVRHDNRLSNLRAVSKAENAKNARCRKDSSSGILGVSWHKGVQKWQARIKHQGRDVYLGVFDNIDAAIAARNSAKLTYGYHPNHGIKADV